MPTGRAVKKLPDITRTRAPGHGGVGQPLAEGGFDFVTQLTGSLLGAVQGHAVGDAHAVEYGWLWPFEAQLFVHLRAKAMHQHNFDAHGLDQRQVLHDALQLACGNRLTCDAHHKGLVSELVDIGATDRNQGTKVKLKTVDMEEGMMAAKCSDLRCPLVA